MQKKRGPYAKSDQRRSDLSKAALALIQERGHRNVAVSDVAALARTSEPTVYYHFPTKEDLFIAALKQHDEENIRPVGHEEGAIADIGPRAEAGVRRTNYARLYNELAGAAADPDHPANAFHRERWARSIHVISTDIRRLQDDGKVALDVDADATAHLILASWEGLQLKWMQGPEFDIRAQLEQLVRALLGPDAL